MPRFLSPLTEFHAKVKKMKENYKQAYVARHNNYEFLFHSTRRYPDDDQYCIGNNCDWYYGNKGLQKFRNISAPKLVFLESSNYEHSINFINDVLPTITNKFVLFIGGYDHSYPLGKCELNEKAVKFNNPLWHKKMYELFNCNKILRIFVENLDMEHPKLEPIPLGCVGGKHDLIYLEYLKLDFVS